jgi:hypothetical protein
VQHEALRIAKKRGTAVHKKRSVWGVSSAGILALAFSHGTAFSQEPVNPHEQLIPEQGPIPGDPAKDPKSPDPEDVTVKNGAFASKYFALSYPLPEGWDGGPDGPKPSNQGVYVLAGLRHREEPKGSLLITAQDMLVAPRPVEVAKMYAPSFRKGRAAVPGMTIDREPTEVQIAGRSFMRVDYSGVGLYRAWLATDIRCHLVSFNFTTPDPKELENLVHTMDKLTLPEEASVETAGAGDGSSFPVCVNDYAKGDNIVQQVGPVPAGPKFLRIPVRIIVGADGAVKHVHIISAFWEARRPIYDALIQWKLKPYELDGHTVEVETGLVFEFKSPT